MCSRRFVQRVCLSRRFSDASLLASLLQSRSSAPGQCRGFESWQRQTRVSHWYSSFTRDWLESSNKITNQSSSWVSSLYCFLICLLLILCFYRVDGVEKLKNAKETIVPIIWFEDGIEKIDDPELIRLLRSATLDPVLIKDILYPVFFALGLVLIIINSILLARSCLRRQSEQLISNDIQMVQNPPKSWPLYNYFIIIKSKYENIKMLKNICKL